MITLKNGASSAVIDPAGAWVERLDDAAGPVFFPKQALVNQDGETKTRGGMHVCLPNFGPGGDSGLDQHGFGRTMEWKIAGLTEADTSLELSGPKDYKNLKATLVYSLGESSFEARLVIKNEGEADLRVAPGFHPYFYLDEDETAVSVNDQNYALSSLAGTEFVTTEKAVLKTAGREITLSQNGLPTWAIWTDEMANYVCVEPTAGGYRFLEDPTPEELLATGEEKSFNCNISW